jgi:hypothetical protein
MLFMTTPYAGKNMLTFRIGRIARDFISCLCVIALGLVLILPLRADPVPSLDELTVIDQGSKLTLIWHFYYKLLPEKPSLPENGMQVDLTNPDTLRDNLTRLSLSAFTLTIDGKPAPLAAPGRVNLAADGGCDATLVYAGRQNARLELRETLLPLYPPSYIINYEIYSPLARARGVTGYFQGGAPSPVVAYTQSGGDYKPSLFDALNAEPVRLFKAELRAAWLNPGWLFLTLIVLLLRPARELYPLAWMMAMAWILPIFIWGANGVQVPFALHPLVTALVTVAITALGIWAAPRLAAFASALAFAGLLNGCLEVQVTSLERPPPNGGNLTGLVLGLIAGFALIFAVALPLLHECRKYPGFQRNWAPKMAGALAVLAVVLSVR